jgi:hypothetical protein
MACRYLLRVPAELCQAAVKQKGSAARRESHWKGWRWSGAPLLSTGGMSTDFSWRAPWAAPLWTLSVFSCSSFFFFGSHSRFARLLGAFAYYSQGGEHKTWAKSESTGRGA